MAEGGNMDKKYPFGEPIKTPVSTDKSKSREVSSKSIQLEEDKIVLRVEYTPEIEVVDSGILLLISQSQYESSRSHQFLYDLSLLILGGCFSAGAFALLSGSIIISSIFFFMFFIFLFLAVFCYSKSLYKVDRYKPKK